MGIVSDAIAVMGKVECGNLISAHLRLFSPCSRKDSSFGYLGNMKWLISFSLHPSMHLGWFMRIGLINHGGLEVNLCWIPRSCGYSCTHVYLSCRHGCVPVALSEHHRGKVWIA
ncbi:hypothetical protein AKJ16_DCAP11436 [Drosera capensis]